MANTKSADYGTSDRNLWHSSAIANLDGTVNVTVSMWVKLNTTPSNQTFFLFNSRNPSATGFQFQLYYTDTGGTKTLTADSIRGVNGSAVITAAVLSTSAWTHVIMKYDGANVYLSTNARANSASAASSGSLNFGGTQSFSIGNQGNGAAGGGMFGIIDDVRVYNTYLSDATTDGFYNSPAELVGNEANLVAYYKFNADLVSDSQTNQTALTLTNTNTVVQSTDVPFTGVTQASGDSMRAGFGF